MRGGVTVFRDRPVALVLSGGNALGAYQAGVYQALDEAGVAPNRISGASAGAINGALIAGSPPAERLARLRALWRPGLTDAADDGAVDEWRRTAAVQVAMASGRAGLFGPRNLVFPTLPFGDAAPPSVWDLSPLGATLAELVDWPLLNRAGPRLCVTAVDVETGEEVCFDTAQDLLTPDHVRASAALMPAFAPVELGGRLLADGGISANLPLDAVLGQTGDGPLLVIAVDLLPLAGPRPRTLTDVASRVQDLTFACQSRRTIAAWARTYAERGERAPAVTLVHLAYADQRREVVGKAFDFSPASIRDRWAIGRRDAEAMLAMLADNSIPLADTPGLHVHHVALRR